ncbi:hypothetical protein CCUN_1308 [Campylobacter cuniculorum DSM 23162 = LMG 24588]|uniref:Uncharacterized protein n=1 Tax=Campylobacter cuniculorum DSM 23162 = LMG 24588 TaxID=1121267 RepID=A0A1W6BXV1_9BACT|nr:hypothetical protein CCUN_1308 [Campylobacter cuniculorum DSM 23162 = LMG 24588]
MQNQWILSDNQFLLLFSFYFLYKLILKNIFDEYFEKMILYHSIKNLDIEIFKLISIL